MLVIIIMPACRCRSWSTGWRSRKVETTEPSWCTCHLTGSVRNGCTLAEVSVKDGRPQNYVGGFNWVPSTLWTSMSFLWHSPCFLLVSCFPSSIFFWLARTYAWWINFSPTKECGSCFWQALQSIELDNNRDSHHQLSQWVFGDFTSLWLLFPPLSTSVYYTSVYFQRLLNVNHKQEKLHMVLKSHFFSKTA